MGCLHKEHTVAGNHELSNSQVSSSFTSVRRAEGRTHDSNIYTGISDKIISGDIQGLPT